MVTACPTKKYDSSCKQGSKFPAVPLIVLMLFFSNASAMAATVATEGEFDTEITSGSGVVDLTLANDIGFDNTTRNSTVANTITALRFSANSDITLSALNSPTVQSGSRFIGSGASSFTISSAVAQRIAIKGFGIIGAANAGFSGRGGAITATNGAGRLVFADGNFLFTGNSAVGGDISSGATQQNGMGGAIYALGGLEFTTGRYEFKDNTASAGNTTGSAQNLFAGLGGAIGTGGGDALFSDGNFIFSSNRAVGADADATGKTNWGHGWGGAAFFLNGAKYSAGEYSYVGNKALGGKATNGGYAQSGGMGGALYFYLATAGKEALFEGGKHVFSANEALGGDADGDGSTTLGSGRGGAWHVYKGVATGPVNTLTVTGGEFLFEDNRAVGGDASGGTGVGYSSAWYSGEGGAIYADAAIDLSGASRLIFKNNEAIGGKSGGDFDFAFSSGLGGGIFAGDNITLGQGEFLGNSASTRNDGDMTSGLGGAIFFNAVPNAGVTANNTLAIKLLAGQSLLFKGNTHNPGNMGEMPNSIYFGLLSDSGTNRATDAVFDVAAGASLLMYDPMQSQPDDFVFDPNDPGGSKFNNLTLNLTKTGGGLWALGGTSLMQSKTVLTLGDGELRMDKASSRIVMNDHADSEFTVKSGAVFTPAIDATSASLVETSKVTVENGAKFSINGSLAALTPGHAYTYTVISASNTPTGGDFDPLSNALMNATLTRDGNDYVLGVQTHRLPGFFGFSDNALDRFFVSGSHVGVQPVYDLLDATYSTGTLQFTPSQVAEVNLLAMDFASSIPVAFKTIFHSTMVGAGQRRERWQTITLVQNGMASTEALAMPSPMCGIPAAHRIWASGTGDWGRMDDHKNMNGFKTDIYGVDIGYDFAFTENMLAGLFLGYSNAETTSRNGSLAKVKSDSYFAGAYAAVDIDSLLIDARILFGDSDNTSTNHYRAFGVDTGGDYHTRHFGADLRIAYDFSPDGCTHFAPFVGLEYYHGRQRGFAEWASDGNSAGFARRFSAKNYDSLEIPIGVRLSRRFDPCKRISFTPTLSLAYAREVLDQAGRAEGHLVGGNTWWTARGIEPGRDIFRVAAGLSARINKRFDVGFDYSLEVRENYYDNRLKLSCGLEF